ncbi:agglutinin biogenesis protein MshP [Massilia sp. G4R7]|uniref:Agglutinin biogenesis protein MshP n=1 Tax=Massilia phyllostachyos TaxID=2898585 RepID=A0ABS8Q432_9BURK|nr:agglutinin biogenesis protein MshP [Massilia phyllostachyos]MCD2516497.1 agglutinin biogenesis protein MshP [Massilia phyllostachyos]
MHARSRFHPRRLVRSAGVGIITAVFLLIVLAGIGVAAVRIFTAQQVTSSLDLDGARAYQAARAGIEWGLFQQLRNSNCASRTFAMPADSVLANFTVSVTCTPVPGPADSSGNSANTTRWRIESIACNQPKNGACTTTPVAHPDFVQRRLEVQV